MIFYLLTKALHIISVISWMAGMLYLPRLFVYHSQVSDSNMEMYDTFLTMERKLLRFIMLPAMILTFLTGLGLLHFTESLIFDWMHAKLLLLVFLFASHGWMVRCYKKFEKRENIHTHKYFRIFNEIPTILMIFIVILVVLKPF